MKRILFPVEDLSIPEKAFATAVELGQSFNSEFVLVHVQPLTDPVVYPYAHMMDAWDEEAMNEISRRIVDAALARFAQAGLKAETRIIAGDPATEIVACASDEHCDLILMNTHGMGPVKRFLLGSVTNRVVHHAKVPILVVR